MSTRMPPRGRGPQRPAYSPPAAREEYKPQGAPKERRKGFFVMGLVAVVLVIVFVEALSNPGLISNTSAPTQIAGGKTQKPGKAGASATPGPVVANLPVITEVMSSNKGSVTDAAGDYTDWIEMYNPTGKTINLAGFALSDNPKKPAKSVLTTYLLEPGKYAIIYADGGQSAKDELHVSFKLKAAGTSLILVDPNGNQVQMISVPKMETDHSYAMDASDSKKWADTDKYTPGFANSNEGYSAYQQTRKATAPIGINEVMPGNTMTIKDEDGDYSDWVELYNPTDKAVDLTGWGLSNREAEPKRWVFPATKIEPGKYIVVFLSGKDRAVEGKELHTNFRLNAFKDVMILSNLRGQIVSEVPINNLKDDTSYGLVPGTTDWQTFTHPTPGYPNTEEGWNALQPKLYDDKSSSPVEINEVMSNNATTLKDQFGSYPDWIELYNDSGKNVDLKGWGLTNKSNELGLWQFPDVSLGPNQYMTVFASGRNLTDPSANLHTNFTIGGSGGVVALTAPNGHIADRCFLPALKVGDTYGRESGSAGFDYITNPTPGTANAAGYAGMAPDPTFSLKAGVYAGDQKVELTDSDPNAKIYYTVNGNPPSDKSTPYSGAIDVQKLAKDIGGTVIRAVAYRDGYLPSNGVCNTYVIQAGVDISLPILSIAVDNDKMFNPTTGMYEKGPNASNKYPFTGANFWKHTELPAHAEFIDADGTVGISQDVGLQIAGQFSRGDVFKGFELKSRSIYGKGKLAYPIFPDQSYTSYDNLVSRPGGQDVKMTGMRDALIISLARDTIPKDASGGPSVFTQDVRAALEFVNGEFWGVTTLHEKIDAKTLAQHYPGVDPGKVDLIQSTGMSKSYVKAGTNKDWVDLINYVRSHDLSVQANYDYVASKMDIDSYINWSTLEICSGNSDTANIRMWKTEEPSSKWRWIFYDFCWTFWDPRVSTRDDIYDDIILAKASTNGQLCQALLKNPGFKDKFLKQLAYNINVTFEPSRVDARIDEIASQMRPYMAAEDAKWHDLSLQNPSTAGYTNWEGKVSSLKDYAEKHPAKLKREMQTYFGLSDAQMQQLFPNG